MASLAQYCVRLSSDAYALSKWHDEKWAREDMNLAGLSPAQQDLLLSGDETKLNKELSKELSQAGGTSPIHITAFGAIPTRGGPGGH